MSAASQHNADGVSPTTRFPLLSRTRRPLSVTLAGSAVLVAAAPASLLLYNWLLYGEPVDGPAVWRLIATTLAGLVLAAPVAAVWSKTARRGGLVTAGLALAGGVALVAGIFCVVTVFGARSAGAIGPAVVFAVASLLLLFTASASLGWAVPATGWSGRRASWKPLAAFPVVAALIVAAVGLSVPLTHPLPKATLQPATQVLTAATKDLSIGDHSVTGTDTEASPGTAPKPVTEENADFNVAKRNFKGTLRDLTAPADAPAQAKQLDVEIVAGKEAGAAPHGPIYRQYLDMVRMDAAAVKTWTSVGHETVDGVTVTHYRGRVDAKLAARASYALQQELTPARSYRDKQAVWQQAGAVGAPDTQVDVWLDDQGRLRVYDRAEKLGPDSTRTSHYHFTVK